MVPDASGGRKPRARSPARFSGPGWRTSPRAPRPRSRRARATASPRKLPVSRGRPATRPVSGSTTTPSGRGSPPDSKLNGSAPPSKSGRTAAMFCPQPQGLGRRWCPDTNSGGGASSGPPPSDAQEQRTCRRCRCRRRRAASARTRRRPRSPARRRACRRRRARASRRPAAVSANSEAQRVPVRVGEAVREIDERELAHAQDHRRRVLDRHRRPCSAPKTALRLTEALETCRPSVIS